MILERSGKSIYCTIFKTETCRRSINTYNHKRIEEDINVKMEDRNIQQKRICWFHKNKGGIGIKLSHKIYIFYIVFVDAFSKIFCRFCLSSYNDRSLSTQNISFTCCLIAFND